MLVLSGILIVIGIVLTVQAHSALQELESFRGSLGGFTGLVTSLTDALGATDVRDQMRQLEVIRGVGIAVAIFGVLVGIKSVFDKASPKEAQAAQKTPERTIYERKGTGTHVWEFEVANGSPHTFVVKSGFRDEFILDGVVLWSGMIMLSKEFEFDVGGEPAMLTFKGMTFRLRVSGRLIE